MRLLVSRTRRAVTLSAAIAAASLAIGAGAAQASVHAPASGVTWHKLFAINGWHSAQAKYTTGDPSWGVAGGVVYLSGSVLRSGSSTSRLFATLPAEARPAHAMWITVYTLDDTTGWLFISPNGHMFADGSSATGFTSLAGVSFPARSTGLTKLGLINGWHSEQTVWHSGDPSYTVRNGVVYLAGSLGTAGSNAQFAVLPKAARPHSVEYISVYTYGGTIGTLQIKPNGIARAYSGSANSFTSLAGVSYPVASASSAKITLLNGWHSEASRWGSGDPAYRVSNGVVYLSGSLATSGTNEVFGVLPAAARPSHILYIKAYTYGSTVGTVEIDPDGTLWAYGQTASNSERFTSLATISFPLKS